MELNGFARAREAHSDLPIWVLLTSFDGGRAVERLACCRHSLLLPEVQCVISTSQGTKRMDKN